MLRPLGLTHIVRHGVLLITTEFVAEYQRKPRVYSLALFPHSAARIQESMELALPQLTLGPWEETDGEGGRIVPMPGCFVICHHQHAHLDIEAFLRQFARRFVGPQHVLTRPTPIESSTTILKKRLKTRVTVRLLNAPLNYALETLQRDFGLRYWLDAEALKEAGIAVNSRVTANHSNTELQHVMTSMLRPLRLRTFVRDETIVITTEAMADEEGFAERRFFDVPAMTAAQQDEFADALLDRLDESTAWLERDGQGGHLEFVGRHLVVRHLPEVVQRVSRELDRLR